MKVIILILLNLFVGIGECIGREATGADFLKFLTASRAAALAGAYYAEADVGSIHYNPAGLCGVDSAQLLLMYSQAPQDASYQALNYAKRITDRVCVGVELFLYQISNLPITEEYREGQPHEPWRIVGEGKWQDMLFNLALAKKWSDSLNVGVGLKYILRKFEGKDIQRNPLARSAKADTIALDLGVQRHYGNLTIGGVLSNIGRPIKFKEEEFKIDQRVCIGARYKVNNQILLSGALLRGLLSGSELEYAAGVEWWLYERILALRFGYHKREGELAGFNGGIGVNLGKLTFDFANTTAGELGRNSQVSVIFSF